MIEIKNLQFKYHQDQITILYSDDVSFSRKQEWLSIVKALIENPRR